MKVRELQEKLKELNPDLDLVLCSEDEELLSKGREMVLFEVISVSSAKAEKLRLDDGTPYLKFGESPVALAIAVAEITKDF